MGRFIETRHGKIQQVDFDEDGNIIYTWQGGPYEIHKRVAGFTCKYDLSSLTGSAATGLFSDGLGKFFGDMLEDFAKSNETKRIYERFNTNGNGEATLLKMGKQIIITFKQLPR